MELLNGLPIKTIYATDKEGKEHIFGVTTDTVDDLISMTKAYTYLVREFDESYAYAVPSHIFTQDEERILQYINEKIENIYKL